jgi:cadmium resistance protein CadD (predicted permease)
MCVHRPFGSYKQILSCIALQHSKKDEKENLLLKTCLYLRVILIHLLCLTISNSFENIPVGKPAFIALNSQLSKITTVIFVWAAYMITLLKQLGQHCRNQ